MEARKLVTKLNRIGWFELTDRLRFRGENSDFPTLMLESTPGFPVTWASDSALGHLFRMGATSTCDRR